jgi:hypothetical protein
MRTADPVIPVNPWTFRQMPQQFKRQTTAGANFGNPCQLANSARTRPTTSMR